jgi:putative ABC transport system ATP-binding protein
MIRPLDELIRLDNASRIYRSEGVETRALSNVSLVIGRGEYAAISGPSGSGKTTLLSILGLLDKLDEGTYHFDGRDVSKLSNAQRARIRNREIGFIFQAFNLIADLTVAENVELPLTHRSLPTEERKARVKSALEKVGMSTRANRYPSQLSGGQQQRVAVARAIIGRPVLLLADEPTGNLDSRNGESVMSLLRELHEEGATLCVVTHDPRYERHAERIINLFDGCRVDPDPLTSRREFHEIPEITI